MAIGITSSRPIFSSRIQAFLAPAALLLALALAPWGSTPVSAQEASAPAAAEENRLTLEAVEAQIEGIKRSESLPAETKNAVLEMYQSAAKELARRGERSRQLEQNQQLLERSPVELEEIERRLKELPVEPATPAASMELGDLRARLSVIQTDAAKARRALDELNNRLERRPKLLAELPQTIETLEERIREIETELESPGPAGDAPELGDARQVLLEARLLAAGADLAHVKSERMVLQNTGPLFNRRKDLETRRLSLFEREASLLEERIGTLEEARQKELAKKALLAAASEDPRVQEVIAKNRELAKMYNNDDFFKKRQIHVKKRVEEVDAILAKVRDEVQRTKRRLEIAGNNEVVSSMMRASREGLPDPRLWRRRALWAGEAASETALLKIEIDEGLANLSDIDQSIGVILGKVEGAKDKTRAAQEEILRGHLSTQRDLYRAASEAYERMMNDLSEYDSQSRQLIEEVKEYDRFIAERILWVANTPAVGITDMPLLVQAGLDLIDPTRWLHAWDVIRKDFWKSPGVYVLLVAGLSASILFRPKLRRRMRALGERVTNDFVGTPHLTLMALAGTIVMAGIWPAAMYYFGSHLLKITAKFEVLAIGSALQKTAGLMLLVEFLKQACRPSGLASAHFRWRAASVAVIRRNLYWLTLVVVPVAFVIALLRSDVESASRTAMVRALFVVDMLALAFFLYRVLHKKNSVAENLMGATPGGWTARLRVVWYPMFVLLPVGLALAAGLGFLDSATLLNDRLIETLGLTVGVVFANAMLLRWLYAVRGQLALRQAKLRREREGQHEEGSLAAPIVANNQVDLSLVNIQTRRMLSMVVALGVLLGMFFIWSDLIPAFRVLDRVAFWSKTEHVWESNFDASTGQTRMEQVEKTTPVTLASFVLVALIVSVTIAAARNVPGFLEITLLAKLPLDAGARFAITTVARYAISLVGLAVASGQLGIRWDSIQWLAAAFTVGLGFGLQEIVANFVSGLILLVERPFRIGDTVTVGDLSGTVTRIQMRATTITDWNRKELIVPNKEFITGQFVNWTLSDRVLRVTIDVGIAYDADTYRAVQILKDIAARHGHVLKDPAPKVIFTSFGDSTLNFSLHVYVDNVDHSLTTRHDLNMSIHREFALAGIDIDYPQQDVNVRFVPTGITAEEALKQVVAEPILRQSA